ncbi:unnamed protein product [Amoebophrya sp. A25]|nr:unnamed protein product [Amoebophrya sp. A25]|eukprot:GSA25T00025879001.1
MVDSHAASRTMSSSASGYPIDTVLRELAKYHRTVTRENAEAAVEQAEMEAKISYLETQMLVHEKMNRDLMNRCKMLENELRKERCKNADANKAEALAANLAVSSAGGGIGVEVDHEEKGGGRGGGDGSSANSSSSNSSSSQQQDLSKLQDIIMRLPQTRAVSAKSILKKYLRAAIFSDVDEQDQDVTMIKSTSSGSNGGAEAGQQGQLKSANSASWKDYAGLRVPSTVTGLVYDNTRAILLAALLNGEVRAFDMHGFDRSEEADVAPFLVYRQPCAKESGAIESEEISDENNEGDKKSRETTSPSSSSSPSKKNEKITSIVADFERGVFCSGSADGRVCIWDAPAGSPGSAASSAIAKLVDGTTDKRLRTVFELSSGVVYMALNSPATGSGPSSASSSASTMTSYTSGPGASGRNAGATGGASKDGIPERPLTKLVLAVASEDNTVCLYDLEHEVRLSVLTFSGPKKAQPPGAIQRSVACVEFVRDHDIAVGFSFGGSEQTETTTRQKSRPALASGGIFNVHTGKQLTEFQVGGTEQGDEPPSSSQKSQGVLCMRSIVGMNVVVTGHADGFRLFDVSSGELLCAVNTTVEGGGGPVHGLAYDPVEQQLLAATGDGAVRSWDLKKKKVAQRCPCFPENGLNCILLGVEDVLFVGGGLPTGGVETTAATSLGSSGEANIRILTR